MRLLVLCLTLTGLPIALCMDDKSDSTREYAEQLWKSNVRKQQGKLNSTQTEHACIVGTADVKTLESIGKATERAIVYAQKSVGYDKEPVKRENQQMSDRPYHWDGKLIVIVCKERQEFVDLFSKIKQAKPDAQEVAAYVHDKDRSYVLIGPGNASRKLNYEVLAVELAGAATLTRRHDPVPRWLAAGFGRMLAHKFDPKLFAAERANILKWAAQYHARDVISTENSTIPAAALIPLQASLVECLTHSPTFADQWFKLLDETAYRNGSFDGALSEMKITHETLQIAWKNTLWK